MNDLHLCYTFVHISFRSPVLPSYGGACEGRFEDNRNCCMFWWQVENVLMKRSKYGKVNAIKKNDIANIGLVSKKLKISGDKVKVVTSFIYIFVFDDIKKFCLTENYCH